MAEKYDAVVIGAGLGGVSAATMLAKNGMKVLLCERHNVPGGYATSFVRGRYEFEIALHELSGIGLPGHRGDFYRYMENLGVTESVDFVNVDHMYRSIFPGLDVTLPVGREAYTEKLCEIFPNEAEGIRRLIDRVFVLAREVAQLTRQRGIGNPLKALKQFPSAVRYLTADWKTMMSRDVKDPVAQAMISQYWGYLGLPPSKASALFFAIMLASYIKLGPAFVKGRSQAMSNAFLATFEKHGGTVKFNTGIEKIETHGGKVTGVVTDQGEAFEANWIVSNADPVTTCTAMINKEKVPASFFQGLRPSQVAASTVNVYLGIDCPVDKLGLSTHENFINADADYDRQYQDTFSLTEPDTILMSAYNTVLPDISPPGTSIVVLTVLSHAKPWYAVEPAEYVATKNRIAAAMIRTAETICPDLTKNAEVVEVATPVTNMRYASALGGSIYGFSNPPEDHSILRMSPKGPLDGLYFVGAWTQPGGGMEPSALSGGLAGQTIVRKARRASKGN
jgi:phytoene dehydrogenase-like protein